MQELRDLFDERLIREIESVSGVDYIKERERWLPSGQKVLQAGEKYRAAEQERGQRPFDRREDSYGRGREAVSPGKGFFEYLSETKSLPEIQDLAISAGDRLLPYQPYTTKFANNRAVFMNAIQKAKAQGHKYIYFPNYKDVSIMRGFDEPISEIEDGSAAMKRAYQNQYKKFESTYKDVPEAIIKELRETFPNLDAGKFDPKAHRFSSNVF